MTDNPVDSRTGEPRKAYSYLRFSTPEQMDGDSLRRQTALAANYAARHSLQLDDKLTYRDLGVSAYRSGNANVGRLGEFLEAVRVGEVPQGSVLLVESLDRISRDHAFDAQSLLGDMVRQGITVVTLLDERAYSLEGLRQDPMGMMYSILGFMRADEESATKSRRLTLAWAGKREKIASKPLTAVVPAWLRLDRDSGQIETVPERAELVRRMFEMTLSGAGQHDIARTFNAEGLPTWGRGKHWHRSYVAKVLRNPAVIGTVVPHVMEHSGPRKVRRPLDPVRGYYPAVISEQVFNEVQALRPTARKPGLPELANLLGSLAACPKCGATMTRVHKGRKSYPAFVCTAAKVGAGCGYKSVRYSAVESRLIQVLPGVLRDREGLEAVDWHEGEVFHAREAVHVLQEEVENLLDAVGQQRSPALLQRLSDREAELETARRELRVLEERRDIHAGPVLGSRIERAAAALERGQGGELNRAEANQALRSLFKRAVINWPEGTVDLEWSAGGMSRVHYAWTGGAWPPASEVEVSLAA